jgi:hypothetical protein
MEIGIGKGIKLNRLPPLTWASQTDSQPMTKRVIEVSWNHAPRAYWSGFSSIARFLSIFCFSSPRDPDRLSLTGKNNPMQLI